MNTRQFNETPMQVAEMGLGTWQYGGDWGNISDETAMQIMQRAVDRGINFFDTADVYGAGRSESLIGEFLKSTTAKPYVATKLGRLKGYPDEYSFELFRECTQDSLRRLGVDALDLTQLHCIPKQQLENGEVFDWLRELQRIGNIKAFGASVETDEEALICLDQPGLVSLQIIFNVFRQKPIHEVFAKAKEKNVAIIARVPLASGLLTGKFDRRTQFPEQDHRRYNRDGEMFNVGETFAGLPFETGVAIVDQMRQYVPDTMPMAQFALRWILDHPEVTVVIPGASKVEQVEANVAAANLPPLSPGMHNVLAKFYEEQVKDQIRGAY